MLKPTRQPDNANRLYFYLYVAEYVLLNGRIIPNNIVYILLQHAVETHEHWEFLFKWINSEYIHI